MQAVATAARSRSCSASRTIVLAGGIESMSRMPYLIDSEDARWGHAMGNFTLVDAMYRDGFTCSLSGMIMGETAELLARQYGISREASEAYAVEIAAQGGRGDRRRTGSATRSLPSRSPTRREAHGSWPRTSIHVPTRRSSRFESSPPVFPNVEGQPGSITAGTSSGITDGGAALVLMSAERARELRHHANGANHRLGIGRRRSAGSWASAPCRRCASCSHAPG